MIDKIILNNKNSFDVIIIGSGPAGISLALELERKKIKIALLEAGERYYSEKSQLNYKGEIEGLFPREHHVTRSRMFGGTIGLWGGTGRWSGTSPITATFRPLDHYDFIKWPIQKKNIDEYLKRATEILEIKNSFKEEEININLKLIEFQVSNVMYEDKFYEKIRNSKYIHLFLNSPMINLIGENSLTQKVNCFSEKEKKNFVLSGKVFVLATGGIENSRILLVEKNRNSNLFNKDLPIGNYWYEHPFNELGKAIVKEKKLKKNLNTSLNHFVNLFNAGDESNAYSFAPTFKLIKDKKILNSCTWLVTHERSNKNWKNLTKNILCLAPNLSKNLLKYLGKTLSCGATIYSSWEQDPEYANRVSLSSSKDKFGNPEPKLIYNKSEQVRKTARVLVEEIGHFLIDRDLGRIVGYPFLFEKNQKYMSEAGWHHMGGTVMGNNSKTSVVDKNLKIHGSNNLFVLGSSVFPTGGHANPTMTIIQLALRLNSFLLKNYFNYII